MNSLEALDELSLMINREKHINSEWNKKINDLKQTIKQDLERKEQLEIADRNNQNLVKTNVDLVNKNLDLQKEIAELKDQVEYFKEEFEGWQSAYEWSQAQNSVLKLENQELLVNKNFAQGVALKYKKAIEIIKNHDIKPINHLGVLRFAYNEYNCHLTQEEFELLKEVLENVD